MTSFNGQKLDIKDILRSYDIGKSDYEEFVETRLIRRSVSLFDPIKKRNIQTFNITDDKVKKKKANVNQESLELKNQSTYSVSMSHFEILHFLVRKNARNYTSNVQHLALCA